MKKIAIMAAGGFVGRSLVEYFSRKSSEYEVLPVTRKDFSLLDENAVEAFLAEKKPDVVIHCANEGGARKGGYSEATDIVANNLRMFYNVERCLPDSTLLINFGSGAQYNKARDLVEVPETALGDVMPRDAYGFSKFCMARYIDGSRHERTLNPTIFGLFGPFEDYTFKFISNACVKNLIGMDIVINQNVRFDYLYVDDFCEILEKLIRSDRPLPHRNFNITPTHSVTLLELADLINRVAEKPSRITVRNPGLNYEYTGDNTRLLENLGGSFDFLPYEESVARLYRYYQAHLSQLDLAAVAGDESLKYCKTKAEAK